MSTATPLEHMTPTTKKSQPTDPTRSGSGRWIPLRFYEGAWRAQKGWREDDYVLTIAPIKERYGLLLVDSLVCIDLDPKNNLNVFAEMRGTLTDTTHTTTKSDGAHFIYSVPEHLRGRIKEKKYGKVAGVDIKRFIYYGRGYSEFEGEIQPLPECLVEQFEKDCERRCEGTATASTAESDSLASDYMRLVEPEQEPFEWVKQVDGLIGCGATAHDVMAWCSRRAKFNRNNDSRIVEHSTGKEITIGPGWLVWHYKSKQPDSKEWLGPRPDAPSSDSSMENEQWLMSKRWNRKEHLAKLWRVEYAANAFFRRHQEVREIAIQLDVDEKRVNRYLHQ